MNEELIRDIVDLQANKQVKQLTADLETNNKALQDNIVAAKQLNDILSQSKGFNEYNKNAAASTKQAEALAKLTAQRQLAEERLAAFQAAESAKAQARADKEAANLKKIEDANNKAAEAARKRAAIVSASTQSDLSSSSSTGGNNTGTTVNPTNLADASAANAATAAYTQNTDAVEKNTLSKKQLALIEAQNKELARQNALALRNQAKELNAAKGSLDQRRAALTRLRTTFDSLNEAERASPFGQRLAKTIPQLNEQVLTLEKSTGRAQRNVGNYTSAFASGANKAFSALKTVANILPGVGLAGLIGFAVEPIINYISQLDIFKVKISEIAKSRKLISDVNLLGAQNAQAEITQLKLLYSTAQNTILSDKQRYEAAKKMQELYPETFKNYSIEQIELGKVTGAYNLLTKEIIATARARASQDKITENSIRQLSNEEIIVQAKAEVERLKIQKKRVVDIEFERQTRSTNDASAISSQAKIAEFTDKISAQTKIIREAKKDSQILDERNLALTKNIVSQQLKGAKVAEINQPKTKDDSKKTEDLARKNAAALIQIQIDALKESADYFKRNADNQNFSLDARLDGLKNFSDDSLKIAKLEGDKEKAAKKLTANEILAVDASVAKNQSKIKEDAADRLLEIERQSRKRTSDAILEQNQKDLTAIEKNRDEELSILVKSFNEGFISQEQYKFRREEIEKAYTDLYIALQIKQLQATIETQKAAGENTEKAEADLAAIQLKYQQLRSNRSDKEHEDFIKRKQEEFELEKQIGQEIFNLTKTLLGRSSELRINAIQDEIAALDKRRNFDIQQVNDSIASEEEKADRIAIINAKADAQQRVLDERVRQEKIKQAKAEKAAAIAQAIINGALAMTKVSAQTGILGFAFSPLIAALTAVQVATIIAQPIPKYKDGKSKGNNYSGAAWVGDGGMSELIIEPDGRMFVTPNKPTLTTVGKDTQVISGPEFKRMVAKPNTAVTNNSTNQMIDISALVAEQKAATKAFKNQKATVQFTTDKGHRYMKMKIDSVNAHIKRNFGR